jgi:hypothetical protein
MHEFLHVLAVKCPYKRTRVLNVVHRCLRTWKNISCIVRLIMCASWLVMQTT